jgi:endogenous inhibitor of DNA gyrase (YacG/DUF329 family)
MCSGCTRGVNDAFFGPYLLERCVAIEFAEWQDEIVTLGRFCALPLQEQCVMMIKHMGCDEIRANAFLHHVRKV